MTHDAILFRISDLETGRPLAEAVVCVPVRYAAIRLPGGSPVPCHGSSVLWREIRIELTWGLPTGCLPASSSFARLFAPELSPSSAVLQWVFASPVDAEPPSTMAARIDAVLSGHVPAWSVRIATTKEGR